MAAEPIDVSILIVSYNTRNLTLACIESVYGETREVSFEVIVLDNASSDGSAAAISEAFPEVTLLASETNLGFASGNNLAGQRARGRYLLLLNPDTVVLDGAIDRIVAFADAREDGVIFGGRTLFSDRLLNPSSVWRKPTIWNSVCRSMGVSAIFPASPWLSADTYGGWARDTVREVDLVSGCFLLIRVEAWRALSGFDTRFFMYGEDWDLCLRAHALGMRCFMNPDSEIVHYGGASERIRADKLVRLFETKVLLYFRHWAPWRAKMLRRLLLLYALRSYVLKAAGVLFRHGANHDAVVWRDVLKRRGEWFPYKG